MKPRSISGLWMMLLTAVVVVFSTISCNSSIIFDSEGDCGVYYRIRFKYDYNMKFADAFVREVNSVRLFVFDSEGVLVEVVESLDQAALESGDFEIELELPSGSYDLVAWCGLMQEESFDLLAQVTEGKTRIEELQVRMNRQYDESGNAFVEKDLLPLFHGSLHLEYSDIPGTYTETISLMKCTNVVRVVLQQLSGEDVDVDRFRFEITDSNGLMDWDCSLLDDEPLTYHPWSLQTGYAGVEELQRATTQVGVALAEFTIDRMVDSASPILTVYNRESGEKVLQIPVADYALLVKGNYNAQMSNQEYLDRQDEYSMTFFLDEDGEWLSASVIINSWRVVINEGEIN